MTVSSGINREDPERGERAETRRRHSTEKGICLSGSRMRESGSNWKRKIKEKCNSEG